MLNLIAEAKSKVNSLQEKIADDSFLNYIVLILYILLLVTFT